MYSPIQLIVKNIGPIEKISYNFSKEVILLTGDNQTDDGQDSNGSGKSFILEAICYSLIGTSFRKVTDDELVREGEEEAFISFTIENKHLSKRLTIERYIYSGRKSSKLIITVNDQEQKQITSVNEGNKFILTELGLGRDDILNYFLISKEKYSSFFTSSDTAKKELISRFSRANLIDDVFPMIDLDIGENLKKGQELEKKILSLKSKIEVLKEEDDPEKIEKEKAENEQKIISLGEEIDRLEKEVENLSSTNDSIDIEVLRIDEELIKVKDESSIKEKIKKEEASLFQISNKIEDLRIQRKESQELFDQIERNLSGLITCPNCKHEFNLSDPDFDPKEGRELKKEIEEILSEIKSNIAVSGQDEPLYRKKIQELNDEVNKIKRLKNEFSIKKKSLLNNKRNNLMTIDNLQSLISSKIKQIEKLDQIDYSLDPSKGIKIKQYEKEIKTLEKNLEEVIQEKSFYDLWTLNFKAFKNYLANTSLFNITNQTNIYLEKLGSSIRVKFDGYKELKGGKTREQIDVRIFKFGEPKGSFGKLSGGEKARVEVALILSLSSLINLSSDSGGLNLVVIDEILESLDSTGLASTVKAMSGIGQHVILVTHGKINPYEGLNEIRVIKKNGISYLQIND